MTGYVLRRLAPVAETIVNSYENGASFDELAMQFNCAPSTIRRLLIDRNIPLRKPTKRYKLDAVGNDVMRAYEKGEDINVIARRYRVQREAVVRYLIAQR